MLIEYAFKYGKFEYEMSLEEWVSGGPKAQDAQGNWSWFKWAREMVIEPVTKFSTGMHQNTCQQTKKLFLGIFWYQLVMNALARHWTTAAILWTDWDGKFESHDHLKNTIIILNANLSDFNRNWRENVQKFVRTITGSWSWAEGTEDMISKGEGITTITQN